MPNSGGKKKPTKKQTKKQPSKRGKIGKIQDWLTQESLTLLQGWARNGLEQQQIAHNIGITPKTLCTWKNQYPEIKKAIAVGKEVADLAIENALFSKALRGDTGAMIFYLKNRKPKEWRDRPTETAIEEARLMLEAKKTEMEMLKIKLEMAHLARMSGEGVSTELNLDALSYEEIETLNSLLGKARLPAGAENEQDKS